MATSTIVEHEQEKEPVLLVQPRNTKSGYAILLKYNCVPRKWHLEGRYGSRTHRVGDHIGLPLLKSPQSLQLITWLLPKGEKSKGQESMTPEKSTNIDMDDNKNHHDYSDLKELLSTSKLIYEIPTISNRIPKMEKFDAGGVLLKV